MPTFVSILNWPRTQPRALKALRAAIDARGDALRLLGFHSLSLLPDDAGLSAVMISRCGDAGKVQRLAAALLPGSDVHVESMCFDDGPPRPAWVSRDVRAAARPDYRRRLLKAIAAGA